jgi:glucose/arabinose dehydrogenase
VQRRFLFTPILLAGAATLLAQTSANNRGAATSAWGENPQQAMIQFGKIYAANCASCHGENREGGAGPALNAALIDARSDDQLHDTIHDGRPGGMPAFKGALSEAEQWQLVNFLRFKAAAPSIGPFQAPVDPAGLVVHTARQTVKLEVVAAGLDTPWAVAFLPDGRKLVTERPGRLRIIDKGGHLLPDAVVGTPKPWVRQDGGFLDVAIDPNDRRNGWIYLSYSEVLPGHALTAAEARLPSRGVDPVEPPSMTVIVRGKIDRQNQWIDNQVIFRAAANFYNRDSSHYGSRFLFDRHGHLFFSLGEKGDMTQAQRLDSPLGKIHRINTDGSVPADNPFVKTPGAIPTIWSYGHRNPEGLAFDPATGLMWESEHGPIGGDELNIIERAKNYGWGVVSMGSQPGIDKRSAPGMVPPIFYYTPAIAPSGIAFDTSNRYPAWEGNLFIAGLAGQLRRVEVKGRTVAGQEIILQRLGRTRAVYTGPDGLLYVLIHRYVRPGSAAAPQGWLLRLQPQG